MQIEERDFIPIIFGSDINTYGMARAFYEEYQLKSIVIGKFPSGPSCNSKIIDYYSDLNIGNSDVFIQTVKNFSEKYIHKQVLLIGCGDNYVELIVKHRDQFGKNVIAPYLDQELLEKLLTKQKFYEMCEQYQLDYPQTLIYNKAMGDDFVPAFQFPVIVKPSNSINYWLNEFEGQKKVYKITNLNDLQEVIHKIYRAGYADDLIIQEYIPGDDSHLRIMVCYSGRDKKVKLMSLAQVMLEEYTPQGLGSASLLVTDYNEDLSHKIKNFLEEIGYVGFSTFDIKYDDRDGKFKALEINCRQGRSSSSVTGAGSNLAKYVTEEYIYNKEHSFQIVTDKILWTVISRLIAFKYVKDKENLARIKQLISNKKVYNPLFLKGDNKLKRLFFLYKAYLGQFLKYHKYYP
ncbi:MAG: ATP-grasp domain-containing protein [Bacillota bacterium]